MKTCTKCGEDKPLSEFHNRTSSKDGKKAACRKCSNAASKKWRESSAEHVRAYEKAYREQNKEAVRERTRRWREENAEYCSNYSKRRRQEDPERYRINKREWYRNNAQHARAYSRRWKEENPGKAKEHRARWIEENRERLLSARRRWWEENRDRLNAKRNQWREDNRDRVSAYQRDWYQKAKNREDVKVRKALRTILGNFLESAKLTKSDRTHKLLGYTAEEFRIHIERQFLKGMEWSNHGEWHIDHIVSVAEYVRRGETDPAIVNCLTNLRPIWAKDNIRKSDKRTHLL